MTINSYKFNFGRRTVSSLIGNAVIKETDATKTTK